MYFSDLLSPKPVSAFWQAVIPFSLDNLLNWRSKKYFLFQRIIYIWLQLIFVGIEQIINQIIILLYISDSVPVFCLLNNQ